MLTNNDNYDTILEEMDQDPLFLEKMAIDDSTSEEYTCEKPASWKRKAKTCSWVKKRNHKKKMVRRFLSMNPAMDYSKMDGTRCYPAIYVGFTSFYDGYSYDPRMEYSFNPYSKVFLGTVKSFAQISF